MNNLDKMPSQQPAPDSSMQAVIGNAIHYWEARRVAYDVILALIFVGWVVLTWPHFNRALTLQAVVFLIVFGVAANICYSAVYLADIPLQLSPLQSIWIRWRFLLLLVGIALAILFTNYWIADEIYPFVP